MAVGILDEGGPRTGFRLVPWRFDDAVVVDVLEDPVDVVDEDGHVVPGGPLLELRLPFGL